MRVLLTDEPFIEDKSVWGGGVWPASWIAHPAAADRTTPIIAAFRIRFDVESQRTVRVHVTADERYELYLDGERIGRGPERGDPKNWFFESYDLLLSPGSHVLVTHTWWLGAKAPFAQMSVRPGFLLAAEGEPQDWLNTGHAAWETKRLGGYELVPFELSWGTGACTSIDAAQFDWDFERGEGDGWELPAVLAAGVSKRYVNNVDAGWWLRPASLPPMLEQRVQVGRVRHVETVDGFDNETRVVDAANHIAAESPLWIALLAGSGAVTIPAGTQRRVIVDLDNYYCAYPELTTSGGNGATVRIAWAEALYVPGGNEKGNRDEIEGKVFRGVWDTFCSDGAPSRDFTPLWWQAGRYLEITIETVAEPLTIDRFGLRETHYPYEIEGRFEASDPRLAQVTPLGIRVLEMCSHETYMDCPYYEQLMYVGDTRLEVLTTYALTHDDRLPRKALDIFDASRLNSGLTQSRYPSHTLQIIPPFSLWWVAMVHDNAYWRDDIEFVRARMPGVRAVLEAYRTYVDADGLLTAPNGWNFMDWVPTWEAGVPPGGFHDNGGTSGVLNLHFIYVLGLAAELERVVGEDLLAQRNDALASELAERATAAFYDEARGLFADDLAHTAWSEHSQCLALLANRLAPDKRSRVVEGLTTATDLSRTTIYFTHYLFETYRQLPRSDLLFDRLGLWFQLAEAGFKTMFEEHDPNTTRSDCHAWGAHPLFHYFATILGIRPIEPGFREVEIDPQLGPLTSASGVLPHPLGEIAVDLRVEDGRLHGSVRLPEGVVGILHLGKAIRVLQGGEQKF